MKERVKMQRIFRTISRLIFVGVVVVLLVMVTVVEVVSLSQKRESTDSVSLAVAGTKVVLASSVGGDVDNETMVTNQVVGDDARPVLIRKYLEKYKSPLVPYSDLIFELSKTYGFDYYWILAIGQQESNLCKKIPDNSFNCWGYGIHKSGTLRFDNYELALRSYAEYLKREYFDKGLNTPDLIMKKYCPNSNGSWSFGVQHFIDEIEAGTFWVCILTHLIYFVIVATRSRGGSSKSMLWDFFGLVPYFDLQNNWYCNFFFALGFLWFRLSLWPSKIVVL